MIASSSEADIRAHCEIECVAKCPEYKPLRVLRERRGKSEGLHLTFQRTLNAPKDAEVATVMRAGESSAYDRSGRDARMPAYDDSAGASDSVVVCVRARSGSNAVAVRAS